MALNIHPLEKVFTHPPFAEFHSAHSVFATTRKFERCFCHQGLLEPKIPFTETLLIPPTAKERVHIVIRAALNINFENNF